MKFFLNAGHAPGGNPDPGAVNHGLDLKEAIVAANVTQCLATMLRNAGHHVMTVQDDSLQYITFRANSYGAHLFLSIHCNAWDGQLTRHGWVSGTAEGTEALVYPGNHATSKLGAKISNAVANRLNIVDRGIKERPELWVLKKTNMDAILLELAFIDNDREALLLRDRTWDISSAVFSVLNTWAREVQP